jgi:MATE family multidrug resistance protein
MRVSLRAIFTMAAPLMVTNAIQAVLNLTDTWFIGRLSTDAVAAMSAIYWLLSVAVFVLGGVGLAVQTFVSQAEGAGRRARASQAAWNAVWAALVAVPLFVLAAVLGGPLLGVFRLDPGIQALAVDYWEPRLVGAWLGAMTWALMSFFNGIGATRLTLVVALVTTVANVPANEWLMFHLDMGMAGAAWGTNLAQACGLLVGLSLMLTGEVSRRYRSRLTWRPRWAVVRRQLAVGFPVGVMFGADVLGLALMQLMVASVGAAGAAATQVVIMLTSIAYMPTLGVATAGATVVGQAIGAGDRDWAARVGNVVVAVCAAMMLSIATLLLVAGPWVMPWFLASEDRASAEAVRVALGMLWFAAAYQLFDGIYFGSSFCLRAAGDTRVPALTALGLSWLLFVPLSHTLVFAPGEGWIDGLPQLGLGAQGGWIALMGYAILLGSAMGLRWRSGRWRGISLWPAAQRAPVDRQ